MATAELMKHFVDSGAYFPVTDLKKSNFFFLFRSSNSSSFKESGRDACSLKKKTGKKSRCSRDLRRGVQADTVRLRGWCRLVIGGEDGKAGGRVDHVIHQVANRRRAKSRALLHKQRVPVKTHKGYSLNAAIRRRHTTGPSLKIMGKHEGFPLKKQLGHRPDASCQSCSEACWPGLSVFSPGPSRTFTLTT